METITIRVYKDEVYEEVAKATDYTGAKLLDGDPTAYDRILATDNDLLNLSRFWNEAELAVNESLKNMLISGSTCTVYVPSKREAYIAELEVSKSFDKQLTASVEQTLRNFFIAGITGMWFKFANKGEAADYIGQAGELMQVVERLLYSRKRPTLPID